VASPDTKERILITAVSQFSRRGFSAVSMREIAKAVGISPPALYNHFASKEELYQTAVSAAFADKAEALLGALNARRPPLERLGGFVRLVAESVRRDPDFRALMQRELLDGDASRLGFLGRVFDPMVQALVDLLDRLRPGCDGFLLSELIFGMTIQHDEMRLLRPHLDIPGAGERTPSEIGDLVMEILIPYFSGAPP
jgi:TetR/AcrR family transcriptional regulator